METGVSFHGYSMGASTRIFEHLKLAKNDTRVKVMYTVFRCLRQTRWQLVISLHSSAGQKARLQSLVNSVSGEGPFCRDGDFLKCPHMAEGASSTSFTRRLIPFPGCFT